MKSTMFRPSQSEAFCEMSETSPTTQPFQAFALLHRKLGSGSLDQQDPAKIEFGCHKGSLASQISSAHCFALWPVAWRVDEPGKKAIACGTPRRLPGQHLLASIACSHQADAPESELVFRTDCVVAWQRITIRSSCFVSSSVAQLYFNLMILARISDQYCLIHNENCWNFGYNRCWITGKASRILDNGF